MVKQKSNWREMVLACRGSGKTAKQWSEEQGIPYQRYLAWSSKFNRDAKNMAVDRSAKDSANKARRWATVDLLEQSDENSEQKAITLCCGKWSIHITDKFNPDLLASVLLVVSQIC